MLVRLLTILIWFMLAASAVAWGLHMQPASPASNDAAVSMAPSTAVNVQSLSALLGAALAPGANDTNTPDANNSSRFKLVGVIAPVVGSSPGVALIAVDNQPARAVPIGATVDADLVLQNVATRGARIARSDGSNAISLELPSAAPDVASANAAATTPAPAVAPVARSQAPVGGPSVRIAQPSEMTAPGRRVRLHGHLDQSLPDRQ